MRLAKDTSGAAANFGIQQIDRILVLDRYEGPRDDRTADDRHYAGTDGGPDKNSGRPALDRLELSGLPPQQRGPQDDSND